MKRGTNMSQNSNRSARWLGACGLGCAVLGTSFMAVVPAEEIATSNTKAKIQLVAFKFQGGGNLKGLLPAEPPESLLSLLANLPESWATWAGGVTEDLAKLYTETPDDAAGQKALLDRLRVRLKTATTAAADPQYAPIAGQLVSLSGGLSRRLDVIDVLLATTPQDGEAYTKHAQALLAALETHEGTGSAAASAAAREAFDGLRASAANNGDEITQVLRQSYLNYNMQVSVSEGFLNRVFCKTQVEQGDVIDCILGANVFGSQVTTSTAVFDLLPAENGARFHIALSGVVNSDTEGTKRGATIYTEGTHHFWANKEVQFDGTQFLTAPATISVDASNNPTHATTNLQKVPLFGAFKEMGAFQAAVRKRPQTEAIAAERVSSRVTPKFDEEVDSNFARVNTNLTEKVQKPLEEMQLYPDVRVFRTTDTTLDVSTRLMAANELGGTTQHLTVADGEMALSLHETAINAFLDRLGVQGKTMTEEELRALIQDKLSKLLNKEVKLAEAKQDAADDAGKAPKAFIFSETDPLRVQVGNGQIQLIIRAGFKREEDDIPQQIVTVPLNIAIEGEEVVITRGDVLVDAQDPPANVAEQVARAGVIKRKLENSLPSKKDSRAVTIHKDNGDVTVIINRIEAQDGWLTLRLQ